MGMGNLMSDKFFYLGEEGKLPILVEFEPTPTWTAETVKARYAILYDAASPIGDEDDD